MSYYLSREEYTSVECEEEEEFILKITVREFIELLQQQHPDAIMYHKKRGIWEPLNYEAIEINAAFVGIDD